MLPLDAAIPCSTRVSAKAIDVCCDPASPDPLAAARRRSSLPGTDGHRPGPAASSTEEAKTGPAVSLARTDSHVHDGPNSHRAKLNAPTRIIAAPANLPLTSPNGIVFSSRTKMAIAAIHSRFITPPTNSNPIRIQQQPTQ